MRRAWRLVQRRHVESAFTGIGARTHGGRWNSPGTAVIYASDSRALAALEVLAGMRRPALLDSYAMLEATFPEGKMLTVQGADLPTGWRAVPPVSGTQRLGDAWAADRRSAVLQVPSVIIPAESNFLFNPAHPDFEEVTITELEAFGFDPRLIHVE